MGANGHTCPRRAQAGSLAWAVADADNWIYIGSLGVVRCSFCGGISDDDFWGIIDDIIAGGRRWYLVDCPPTYRMSVARRGSPGHWQIIPVYLWHLDPGRYKQLEQKVKIALECSSALTIE